MPGTGGATLSRTHAVIGVLVLNYAVVFALVVDLLGFPLGFITMCLLGQAAVGVYVLLSRRY